MVISLTQNSEESKTGGFMQGLWTVEFGSTTGQFGAGVVVFQDGHILGGDNGYFYTGTYIQTGPRVFHATIDITAFVEGIESVFSTLGKNLKLRLVGILAEDGSNATAQGALSELPQSRLGVKLVKRT
jgi:T3SS negative regulator,GrlR